jgi:hypothetical protein
MTSGDLDEFLRAIHGSNIRFEKYKILVLFLPISTRRKGGYFGGSEKHGNDTNWI